MKVFLGSKGAIGCNEPPCYSEGSNLRSHKNIRSGNPDLEPFALAICVIYLKYK